MRRTVPLPLLLLLALCPPAAAGAAPAPPAPLPDLDRVLPLSRSERFGGAPDAGVMTRTRLRQLADELHRAADSPFTPGATAFEALARASRRAGEVALAVVDARVARRAPGAGPSASPRPADVFAFAPLTDRTWRGAEVGFRLEPAAWFGNRAMAPARLTFDAGDGRGARAIRPGEVVRAHYAAPGRHRLRLDASDADGAVRTAYATFEVAGLAAPTPDDTLDITASVPYQGVAGTGRAYVRLAPGRVRLTNPVVLVEGFDLDNSMGWDELHALMNVEGLADSLAADGFDAVVLDFTDATDAIQRNAVVVEELLRQVAAELEAGATIGVIGASMGGLCSRYALAWMEANAVPHRVRTWIAFDTPHGGANIPLGIQYWVDFFASQSADAALFRAQLDRPAARQMLLAHLTSPPSSIAAPDPLRAGLLLDLAAIGDWPQAARRVAIVNGSGLGQAQGFAPGAQLVRYEYSDLFAAATGNVWALRDQASQLVFDGRLRILFSTTTRQVTVSGSPAWDGAPGGWRASMAQMDAVEAPVGDIVALHPSHAFIPTVSALALATSDPFYDVAGDPDLLAHTPFDAVYVPGQNQEHVAITAESAAWFRDELARGVVAAPAPPLAPMLALRAGPNPFRGVVHITAAAPGAAGLTVHAVDGARVRTLATAGAQAVRWDGCDDGGRPLPPGLYFLRLHAGVATVTRRVVKLD